MKKFFLLFVPLLGVVFFIGNTDVSQARGKSRKFAADAASANRSPQPIVCPPSYTRTAKGCVGQQTGSRPVVKPPGITVAPIITKAPASVDAEGDVTVLGKNFIRVGGKTDMFNVQHVFWVKGNSEVEAKGVGVVANPQEEDKIGMKAPKEPGTYSIKVVTAKGSAVWNNPLVSVLSLAPVITKAPTTVDPEESTAIYGKNFIRINGKSELFNLKDVFWVKGNSETKAQGVSSVGNPGKEDRINVKAPKEPGTYSIKVVTAKGSTVWNNPPIVVAGSLNKKTQVGSRRSVGREITPAANDGIIPLPPPPPPSQVTKKQPPAETVEKQQPQEEPEMATRKEPQEEAAPGHCKRGTWSPTLRTCVEDQAPEEVAPPDCGAGQHWSPTLKSCQAD